MIHKLLCLILIVSASSAYCDPSVSSNGPVYSGPITLTRAGMTEESSKESKNPFIFEASLDGSNKYAHRLIVLKKNWKSFSMELDSEKIETNTKNPYVRVKLLNRQKGLYQQVYFWNTYEKGEAIFHTTDPDIPRDGEMRILQHKGKTIIGKQVIQFEKSDVEITVLFNGEKLVSFPKIDDFEYIQIGTKGLKVRACNLKINGYKY